MTGLSGCRRGGDVLYLRAEARILHSEPLKLGEWGLVVVQHGEGCLRAEAEDHQRCSVARIWGGGHDGGIAVVVAL